MKCPSSQGQNKRNALSSICLPMLVTAIDGSKIQKYLESPSFSKGYLINASTFYDNKDNERALNGVIYRRPNGYFQHILQPPPLPRPLRGGELAGAFEKSYTSYMLCTKSKEIIR